MAKDSTYSVTSVDRGFDIPFAGQLSTVDLVNNDTGASVHVPVDQSQMMSDDQVIDRAGERLSDEGERSYRVDND